MEQFPRSFQKAVGNFKRRALKNSDRDIFLSVCSSIPVWEEDNFISPYHFIRLGTKAKDQSYKSPDVLEAIDYQQDGLVEERAECLKQVFYDTLKIKPEMSLKVNFQVGKILMVSFFNSPITPEDYRKIVNFRSKFMTREEHLFVDEATKRSFCKKVREVSNPSKHLCDYCVDTSTAHQVDAESSDNSI
ncbi:hypothetical protein CMV_026615 [Castanea mollissima]|uniref:Uncharacterized protein n=1 Tax=Castanea mollissima TaxID=60419 RepID=A0A8J4QJP5_9ROSI|nr:hypothetical protein CMV_026615 [Castanea mollissima]